MMTDGKPSDSNSLSSWIIPGAAIIFIATVWIVTLWHFSNISPPKIIEYYLHTSKQTPRQFPQLDITIYWILCVIIYHAMNYYCISKNTFRYTTAFVILISLFCTYLCYEWHSENQPSEQIQFIWGGFIISSWLSTILSISYSLNKLNTAYNNKIVYDNSNNYIHIVNTYIVIIIFFLSTSIYFFPKTKINPNLIKIYNPEKELLFLENKIVKQCREGTITGYNNLGNLNLSEHTFKIMEEEHEKATKEIDQRTAIDDSWFHKKFVLVGGLFAAFLAYFSPFNPMVREKIKFSPINEQYNRWKELTNQISDMFRTNVPSSILGMAFIVSLAIDIHIRHNQMITQQLGLWIMYFVECLLSPGNTFIGWERFLRVDLKEQFTVKGMHRDLFFSILNAVHFYFTSIILYILYISCLALYVSRCPVPPQSGSRATLWLIFGLVHFMLLLFALQGNIFPSTLDVQLVLWPGMWFRGDMGGFIPAAICGLVTYLAFMRLFTLLNDKKNLQGHGENKEKSQDHEENVQVQSDSTPLQN